MTNVLPFRNPKHRDVDGLTMAIFATLANCRGVDHKEVLAAFRKAHPEITPADITGAFIFARKVLRVFEDHLLSVDEDGDAS
jgi:hypothetical protein